MKITTGLMWPIRGLERERVFPLANGRVGQRGGSPRESNQSTRKGMTLARGDRGAAGPAVGSVRHLVQRGPKCPTGPHGRAEPAALNTARARRVSIAGLSPRLLDRARPAGHSPMAVRAAETMTTGSEPALILPHDRLTCSYVPVLRASEATHFPRTDHTAGRNRRPSRPAPREGGCAGARMEGAGRGGAEGVGQDPRLPGQETHSPPPPQTFL